jgi:cyclophilin family peptidyl-prolyl cis-trans isomerase
MRLPFWDSLRQRDPRRSTRRPARRLEVEALEERSVPTANVANALTGTAFVDHNGTGVFGPGDALLPGVSVTLSGTSFTSKSVSVSTTTNANGVFTFLNVPKGTYSLSVSNLSAYLGGNLSFGSVQAPAGVNVISNVTVAPGQNNTASLRVRGLAPTSISLEEFLSSSSGQPFGSPGPGSTAASGPFVKTAISNVTVAPNGTQVVDLAANFSAPDITNSTVRFDLALGSVKKSVDITLFDQQAPQTVQNFLDYVTTGDYNNSIFSRFISNFVLQGGGLSYSGSPPSGTLTAIEQLPNIANEFGVPNNAFTLAMAQSTGPNSANNEFFINMVNNPSLDTQQFAVFGKLATAADQQAITSLTTTKNIQNLNMNASVTHTNNPTVDLGNVPMLGYGGSSSTFPGDAAASNFLMITHAQVVSQNEALTYTVTSSKPAVATAVLGVHDPERITVTGKTAGTATITVIAKDQYGNQASTSFTVTVT